MSRITSRWGSDPSRTLIAVLLLMLLVTGGLAVQAWDAARSHRRVTEAALRDYAAFAGWELKRRAETRVSNLLNSALLPARLPMLLVAPGGGDIGAAEATLARVASGIQRSLQGCACAAAVTDFFVIERDEGRITPHRDALDAELRSWLSSDFLAQVPTSIEDPFVGADTMAAPAGQRGFIVQRVVAGPGVGLEHRVVHYDPRRAVVYTVSQPAGEGQRILGMILQVDEFVAPLLAEILAGQPLLPPSLTGSADNGEVLSILIRGSTGATLHHTSGGFQPGTQVIDTLDLGVARAGMEIAVRPEFAGRLVIGGLPRSRVPLLLGSVVTTLLLMLIALQQLRRQQELFRLRSNFVSGVSHELRTPLAQIRLFADLLGSGRLEQAQRSRALRILTEEAQRLTHLVENVLRFSRADRNAERIASTPVLVEPLLREIVDSFAPLARAREVTLELDAPAGLQAPLDPDAIRQVMLNLLDNAVKYGPREQRIRVDAHLRGERVLIAVEDEGPGVPPADRERIWEPYRRLAREVEAATGGSGIGLAVVRQLVDLHGGRAYVEERSGGGSRFVVELPGAEMLTDGRSIETMAGAASREARV